MNDIWLTGDEPLIARIVRAAYPAYNGKKIRLCTTERIDVRSYWSGGSRDYFVFVNLATMETSGQVPLQSAFDRPIAGADAVPIPDGVACVEHIIFQGKDLGIRIHVNAATMNPHLLPAPVELDEDEQRVAYATAHYKNTYGGRTEIRLHRSGLPRDRFDAAKARLIARGLLNKAGAITTEGRNAVRNVRETWKWSGE